MNSITTIFITLLFNKYLVFVEIPYYLRIFEEFGFFLSIRCQRFMRSFYTWRSESKENSSIITLRDPSVPSL